MFFFSEHSETLKSETKNLHRVVRSILTDADATDDEGRNTVRRASRAGSGLAGFRTGEFDEEDEAGSGVYVMYCCSYRWVGSVKSNCIEVLG